MQRAGTYSHHHAEEVLRDKGILDEIIQMPDQPHVAVIAGNTGAIKDALFRDLVGHGWAMDVLVNDGYNLTVNALKERVGLTSQTGNIARAFYDLMKFEVMYVNDRIDVAVLIVPTLAAASIFGNNVANFARISNEMHLFRHVITVPCFLVSFE